MAAAKRCATPDRSRPIIAPGDTEPQACFRIIPTTAPPSFSVFFHPAALLNTAVYRVVLPAFNPLSIYNGLLTMSPLLPSRDHPLSIVNSDYFHGIPLVLDSVRSGRLEVTCLLKLITEIFSSYLWPVFSILRYDSIHRACDRY